MTQTTASHPRKGVTDTKARRTRDRHSPHPAQRIVNAARQLISRSGLDTLTHRSIAKEADVPLGSTTYYFGSLGEIIEAALEEAISEDTANLKRWADAIEAPDDLSAAMTERIMQASANQERELAWYQLYLSGARAPHVQELCFEWSRVMTRLLERFVEPVTAEVLSALYDALIMRVMVSGGYIEKHDIERTIRSIIDATNTT